MTVQCDTATSNPEGMFQAKAPSPAKAGAHEWLGLALLALPTILLGLDLTLLHLALPALAADLQPTSTEALWIMDAYGFMIAGFLITMGTLGDRIGRRKLLMIGATAFAVASVIAAFSTSATMLIAARAALGVAGFSLAYLGLGTIAALGTGLVVGSAPPEKAGSASAMSETVQDLGVSLGIAILGSLATAIYRRTMLDRLPENLAYDAREAVSDSLWAASAIAPELPAGLIEEAQISFIAGFQGAAVFSAVSVTVLVILAAVALRHVGTIGQSD